MTAQRQAIFDALVRSAPHGFGAERQRAFIAGDGDLLLADLKMDSLSIMEFCIAIELATGVPLVPEQLARLPTVSAVEQCLLQSAR